MNERTFFNALIIGWFVLAGATGVALLFIDAPYGRHVRRGWGPTLSNRLGWLLMELPAPVVFAVFFVLGEHRDTLTAWIFLLLWEAHYVHRALVYPFGLRGRDKRMPLVIAGVALIFNTLNGYLNSRYLFHFSGGYPTRWLRDPRFVAGVLLFLAGYAINRQADRTLRHLRARDESGYKIPYGGLYRWVSCPNYLGELIEWFGWALATWSPAGLAFAVWAAANLVPRARSHHRWYRDHFPEYPPGRAALLPGLW